MITLDRAYLIGFGLEALIYGIYVVVFCMAMAFLLWRRKTRGINWPMVIVTLVLFAGGSIHFWWNFQRTVEAFIDRRNEKGGPAKVVFQPAFQLPIDASFSVNNFLGDAVLIYRCWLVWERNWYIIIVPSLLLLVSIISSAFGLHQIAHLGDTSVVLTETVRQFGIASFIITLCLNAILTLLIAGRIWAHARRSKGIFQDEALTSPYTAVVGIIIESGAVFLVVQALYVGFWKQHNLISTAVVLPAAQIYCLAPTLIIARVGLGLSSEQSRAQRRGAPRGQESSGSMRFASVPAGADSVVVGTLQSAPHSGTTDMSYVLSERNSARERKGPGVSEEMIKLEV